MGRLLRPSVDKHTHATTRSLVSSAVRDSVISRSRIAQPSVAAATSVAELDGDVGMASRYHLRHAGKSRDGVGSRGPGGAAHAAPNDGAAERGMCHPKVCEN